MENKRFLGAKDVQEILKVSETTAYRVIKKLNNELEGKGYIVISGKISKKYFEEKVYMWGVLFVDQTLKELIEKEKISRNQLELADSPDEIQNALIVMEKARQVTSAYLIYKKKEHEYNLAIKEKDRHIKIMQELELVLKNTWIYGHRGNLWTML